MNPSPTRESAPSESEIIHDWRSWNFDLYLYRRWRCSQRIWSATMCQTAFTVMPSPHVLPTLLTRRNSFPRSIPAAASQSLRASGRLSVYKTPTNSASGALRPVTGKCCLPDARNETLCPCRVRRVFVAKLLNHHPLLRADAKRAEDRERDQVRRTCHPIRDDERLADGIQR
jgi:hypothetical protein